MISGFDIAYQVNGADTDEGVWQRMSVAFERAGDNVADFKEYVWPELVPVFESEIASQFSAEGQGPNRGSWAQLSATYDEWKQKNFPGNPILVRTGKLREALTQSSSPFAKRDMADDEFDFGTSGVEYASYHQTGTAFMPDRPPFDFTGEFEAAIQKAALEGVRAALRDAGADEFLEMTP